LVGLPNTSVQPETSAWIAMTGRHEAACLTIGALFLILCGLVPKVAA